MVVSKSWYLTTRPVGVPKKSDFTLKDETIPPCENGDVIVQVECLSVDPYLRYMARQIPLNTVMSGTAVCRVIESKNTNWPVGIYLVTQTGWRTYALVKKATLEDNSFFAGCTRLPDLKGLPHSMGLGALGMPGNTAYFGLLELCNPKSGETVLVNGAAGAVGSLVVQIAKLKGCKVVAFAGSDEKVAYVKKLGADHVFNYKKVKVGETLKQLASGINCYFDNVGGQFTAEVLPYMADRGRISLCGAISCYNDEAKNSDEVSLHSPYLESTIIWKQLRVEGFLVERWRDRWMEGIEQLREWILQGKVQCRETVTKGFEKMPDTFAGLFSGDNIGKAIIQL